MIEYEVCMNDDMNTLVYYECNYMDIDDHFIIFIRKGEFIRDFNIVMGCVPIQNIKYIKKVGQYA